MLRASTKTILRLAMLHRDLSQRVRDKYCAELRRRRAGGKPTWIWWLK